MAQISARTAKWAKWSVVPAALLVSGLAVSQASYSAFSSTVASPASNWASGTVVLGGPTGGNASSALFTAPNMKPGDGATKCITVTSSGSLDSSVKLYATNPTTTKNLSSNILLTIEAGTGIEEAACEKFTSTTSVYTGTLDGFGKLGTNYTTGIGAWDSTGGTPETRTYKITYKLNAGAQNDTQGGTASVGFTWEAQNK